MSKDVDYLMTLLSIVFYTVFNWIIELSKAFVVKASRKLSKYYFYFICALKVQVSFVSLNEINFYDLQQHCSCSLPIQSKLLNRIFHSQLQNGLINSTFVNCNDALGARVRHDQGDDRQPRPGTARHQQRGRCHPLSARLGKQTPVRPAKVSISRSIIHQLQVSVYSLIHKCTFGRLSRSLKFSTAAIFSVYWNSNVFFEQIISTRPHGKTFSYHLRLRLHDPSLVFLWNWRKLHRCSSRECTYLVCLLDCASESALSEDSCLECKTRRLGTDGNLSDDNLNVE